MRSIKYIFVVFCFSFLFQSVTAQQVEIGLMLGGSNYSGDLSNEYIVAKETHFSGALFGRYNISKRMAVKGFMGYGQISGDDKNFGSYKNNIRNLNFTSDIYEFSVHAEYNFLKNNINSISARPFLPYAFGGIGVFSFNPKTVYKDVTYELQPLGTEGQGTTSLNDFKKYDLTTLCIPIGLGFRQKIGDDFFLGVEAGVRFTATNYLDDVGGVYADPNVVRAAYGEVAGVLSDRSIELTLSDGSNDFINKKGDARSVRKYLDTDMYFMAGITLSYVIRSKGMACPQF
jgi:hypothetical protein